MDTVSLTDALEQKLRDPEEKVRDAAIAVFAAFGLTELSFVPVKYFRTLVERCRDKKVR